MRKKQATQLRQAAYAALKHWHDRPSNFHRKEPAYLELLRAALRDTGGIHAPDTCPEEFGDKDGAK
jgi:hypothetical protein